MYSGRAAEFLAGLTTLACLLHYSVADAGIRLQLTQKGLDFLASHGRKLVVGYLTSGKQQNFRGSYNDNVRFELRDLAIKDFNDDHFTSSVRFEPGFGIVWTVADLTVDAEARYRAKFSRLGGSGYVYIKVYRYTTDLLLSGERTSDGRLRPVLEDCQVYISAVNVRFAEGWTDRVLTAFTEEISRMAKNLLQQHLCDQYRFELVPLLQEKLMSLPSVFPLFDSFYLNQSLLSGPTFEPAFVETQHDGGTFVNPDGGTVLIPFMAPPLQPAVPDESSDRMLHIFMSNYTIGSLMYWMDQQEMFDYKFSGDTSNAEVRGYLRTECGEDEICAGTFFPSLASRYPNGSLEIDVKTITYPSVLVQEGRINVSTHSVITGFALSANRRDKFLSTDVALYSQFEQLALASYTLTGELILDTFLLSNIESTIDEIDLDTMEFLITGMVDILVKEDLAKILRDGVRIPKLLDFDMASTEVKLSDGLIYMGADFCLDDDDSCERASVTKPKSFGSLYSDSSEDYGFLYYEE